MGVEVFKFINRDIYSWIIIYYDLRKVCIKKGNFLLLAEEFYTQTITLQG